MKILFDRPEVLFQGKKYVTVENSIITQITDVIPNGNFDRIISGADRLLIPGLYNCHTHVPMTLFRGYGEDLPLKRWLEERIFPAEDMLTRQSVYTSSMFTMAEMIKNGIVSFSDMYFFSDEIVRAAVETGMKANISRPMMSFDSSADLNTDIRFTEAKALFEKYHNCENGRIKIDMALHAEYTNTKESSRFIGEYAREIGASIHLHLSETEEEHNGCIARHRVTPTRFFYDLNVLDVPVNAAHCVWVTDEDISILAEKNVSVSHNPVSNLKLGSGVLPLSKMLESNVNVALGCDGNASNNTQDIMKEMYVASILSKGISRQPDKIKASEIIKLATESGARLQRREGSGKIAEGCRADLVMLDLGKINNIPYYDTAYALLYSASSSDVLMTMIDGKILYENGSFTCLDIERIKYNMRVTCENYFKK